MLDDDNQRSTDSTASTTQNRFNVEGPFDQPSLKTLLLCVGPMLILGRLVGAIIFLFLITNHATNKSATESLEQSIMEVR